MNILSGFVIYLSSTRVAGKVRIMVDVKDPVVQHLRSDDFVTIVARENKYTVIIQFKSTQIPIILTTTYVDTEGLRELRI